LKGYANEAGAVGKRVSPNADDGVRYGYVFKAGTLEESFLPNIGDGVWYGYAGKSGAVVESAISNVDDAVGYGYAGKSETFPKSVILNVVDAVGYGYAGNFGASLKSGSSNDGNRFPVYLRRYDHIAPGPRIFGNGYCAKFIFGTVEIQTHLLCFLLDANGVYLQYSTE
jgi:hypothetical protein